MLYRMRSAAAAAALAATLGAAGAASAQETPWTASGSLAAGDSRTSENQYYDDHRVTMRAGQRVRISATGTGIDTMLQVYPAGAAGEPLAMDDDSGGELNPRLQFTPPGDGEYVVRVLAYSAGSTGAYSVRVEPMAPLPPPVTAHSDTVTTTGTWRIFQGALAAGDPENEERHFDDYRITVAEGAHVMIQLDSAEFDPLVQILPANADIGAEALQSDDDGGPGLSSLLVFDAPEAGDYIVRVTSYGPGSTGAYRLSVTP